MNVPSGLAVIVLSVFAASHAVPKMSAGEPATTKVVSGAASVVSSVVVSSTVVSSAGSSVVGSTVVGSTGVSRTLTPST